MSDQFWSQLPKAKERYRKFIDQCQMGGDAFALTPRADASGYALCFAIFGLHLLRDTEALRAGKAVWSNALERNLCQARGAEPTAPRNKAYRQLLAFTLSALSILDAIDEVDVSRFIEEQLPVDPMSELSANQALQGKPQSGNQAMFLAIFLLHARLYMNRDTQAHLDAWVSMHCQARNRNGFWGATAGMTHLQFQNGYHQYEIFEFLDLLLPESTATGVSSLADAEGHFAPYPGGGGCYDYDAVFMLTPHGRVADRKSADILRRTAQTILSEQTSEGGWGESIRVRPRSLSNFYRFSRHVFSAISNPALLMERARAAVTLQRPRYDRIHTHWSKYSRRWDEADLWDSWFRMLAIARIQVALEPATADDWGFINYPGIGYHPAARRRYAPQDCSV